MMHALLNYDVRSPKIMMNAEGKVPKKGFAYSHMWKVSIVAGCRKHLHTVCANFLLTAHSVYGCFLNAVTMMTFHCLRLMELSNCTRQYQLKIL